MAKVLIICPTFDHADTLFASIGSVRAQSFTEWEMAVILDGAPPRTSEIMDAIANCDDRIRVYRHPKSERYGEIHRDPVIRGSNAEFICHLGDDDIYLPGHLSNLIEQLGQAEWVNQAPLRLNPDLHEWLPTNYGTRPMRRAMAEGKQITSGINYVAYRRDAYLRLPVGWTCAPWEAGASDVFMWSKFFNDKDLSVASSAATSALKFPSRIRSRRRWSPETRLAEITPWLARAAEPGLAQDFRRNASIFNRILVLFAVHGPGKDLTEAFARAGLASAAATAPPAPAVNGAPMVLPLTKKQDAEAAEAWLMAKAYAGNDAGARHRVAAAFSRRAGEWLHGARVLSTILGVDAALDVVAHCKQTHPGKPGPLRVAARLLVEAGRREEAAAHLDELEAGWPDNPALAELRGMKQG